MAENMTRTKNKQKLWVIENKETFPWKEIVETLWNSYSHWDFEHATISNMPRQEGQENKSSIQLTISNIDHCAGHCVEL